jgi:gliding motility-associated-like protein
VGKLFIILSFTSSLLFIKQTGAQTVDFSFSTSNNLFCAPQQVRFTQNCTGNPESFIWSFGNGVSGANANETVTYLAAGSYTVSLTATYANSAITTSKTVIINTTPVIAINANRNYICQPGNIVFTAPGSPFLLSYEWNFGDGTPVLITSTNSATHFFNSYNNYSVTVKGITGSNCSVVASMNVSVSKFNILASVFPVQGCLPVLTTFNATVNLPVGDAPANFTWVFGDGSPNGSSATGSQTHLYNTTNTISTASVSITSVQGCVNQFDYPVFGFGTPPFNTTAYTQMGRDTFCGSETVRFYASATNANLYVWDFGDGTNGSSADTTITHKYKTLGPQQVIVTPYFNGCAGQKDTVPIFITGVIAGYVFTNQCSTKNMFLFNNTSIGNITQFEWSFSDAPLVLDSTNFHITHLYPVSGSFQTKLYLYDAVTGCSDSSITRQYTAIPLLTSSKQAVCKDSLITYTTLNTYDAASGFIYDFHVNGITIPAGTQSFINVNPVNFGSFNDYVVIINPAGNTCNDSVFLNNATRVQGPVVGFTVPPQICQAGNAVLNNTSYPFFSTDSILKWDWNFGDNTKDSIRNPAPHYFPAPGNYNISLKATDKNNCVQSQIQNIMVFPMPIVRTLPAIDTICLGQSIPLIAYTIDSLLWAPNINISCAACDTVLVNPTVTTNYIAQATNSFGCTSKDTSLVKVYGPIVLQITPADTFVCPNQLVTLHTNQSGITNWSPATYLNATNIPNPVSNPDSSIQYTVTVRDSVGCYADTAQVKVNTFRRAVVNAGPDMIVPYNTSFTFNPAYSNNIATYFWSPLTNGLTCNHCASPSGISRLTETYTIKVESVNGCKASDVITVFVKCDKANLYIPTAFTPNGDGKNDIFYPVTRGYQLINKLVIYNRWGKKVFERSNFQPNTESLGWKGFEGSNLPLETEAYVWYIEATCDLGDKINSKGTVVLIR